MGMWALPTIVYDEAAERTVVAADNGWGAYDATHDRWAILAGAGSGTPAVYDPVNRRLIVFGGGVGDLEALDLVSGESTVLLEASTAPTEPLPE
jgi:hypothetical protein